MRYFYAFKRELLAAENTNDEEQFTAKSVLLRRQKEEYNKFSKVAGLLTENERTQVAGFGRSQASKAVWADKKAQTTAEKGLTSGGGSGMMKERNISTADRPMANGLRRSSHIKLTENDKQHLLQEISVIKADSSKFVFRDNLGSGYSDEFDIIFVSSNVFPSSDNSTHPRDLMSERAVLAHEYYGHREHRNTSVPKGAWNDEFRASYSAAKNCPNLSDEDRYYLVLDALERAKEAGVSIKYNDFIRSILYG